MSTTFVVAGLAIIAGMSIYLFGTGILFALEYISVYNKNIVGEKLIFKMRDHSIQMFAGSGICTAFALFIGLQ